MGPSRWLERGPGKTGASRTLEQCELSCSPHGLIAAVDAKLAVDMLDVGPNCVDLHVEGTSDLERRLVHRQEPEYLEFTFGQGLRQVLTTRRGDERRAWV